MKYLFYQLYRENEDGDRLRPIDEMVAVTNILWDDDINLAIITSSDASDIFIPMDYENYVKLLEAFKTGSSVELSGYYGFNELVESNFSVEMTEKEIEDANNELINKVRSSNDMSEMKLKVF